MNDIVMPEHAHILTAYYLHNKLRLYVLVRTEKNRPPWYPEVHTILVTRTGEEIPDSIAGKVNERKLRWISSSPTYNTHTEQESRLPLSVHIFEVLR
jgi:hypothetical protein